MKAKENIFSDGAMPRNLLENHSFQQLLNSLDIGIFISDIFFNRLISFTNNLEKILGCNSLELKHTPEIWGQILRSQEGSKLDDLLIRALDRSDRINFDLKIEDGHGKIKKIWISLLYSNGSHDHEILGKIQDVTDLREKEIAIAKMESMESEISARIQQKLLLGVPRNPPDGVKIDANSIPSRKVDGDFYDFNRMHDNVLDFFIGDVMGKGLNAALLGAGAKNLFNKAIISLITAGDNRPVIEKIVDLTDSYLTKELIRIKSFITLNYGRLDMDRAVYRYIDCGHNPVIHYNCREDFCWILKGKNMPLGFKDHQLFTSSSIPLAKGDILFLYSDGITEVLNSNDEPFGIERLIHLIKGFRELDPHELVQRVLNVGFNYSHEGFDDDATSLAIKICHMEQTKRPWGNILFSITEIQTSTIIEKLHQAWVKEDTIYQCKKIKNLPENLITAISCLEAYEQQETSYEDFQSDFEVLHSLDEQQKTSLCESIYWTLRDEELFIEINYIGKSPNTESLDLLHNIFDSITLAEGLGQYKKICGRLFLN